ncbi:hypothetical protein HQQ81_06260 [Microbacteriaceae bacterium VKM Ac-2854]|nr:hypothetical protein [Microbacteriaceae bacterium VKM Ac-2854]
MTEAAPLDRPLRNTPLMALAGVVHADPDACFAALAAALRPTDSVGAFTADAPTRTVIRQGGWWYRGEWRVLEHEDGSRVEHELINVARPAHWAGPITGRAVIRAAPGEFQRLLSRLVSELE